MKLTEENRTTRGKTCLSATLSTTNPKRTNPGLNSDLRGERPATNRLSRGTAQFNYVTNETVAQVQWLFNVHLSNCITKGTAT